ncbi:MAG: sulfotransferase [Verrucomicrobiota bacterium]
MTANCFILGGQKCGSTWLASRLNQHPEVFVAPHEIHFFDKPYNYTKGFEWYETHFNQTGDAKIIAEKTPEYLWAGGGLGGDDVHAHEPRVHELIRTFRSDAKFVVVLRDPVERVESAINHFLSYGYFWPWVSNKSIIHGSHSNRSREFGLLEKGDYFSQLSAYFRVFPREQFIVFEFQRDIVEAPEKALDRLCSFLKISSYDGFVDLDKPENGVVHSLPGMIATCLFPNRQRIAYRLNRYFPSNRRRLDSESIHWLKRFYFEKNELLFNLIGERFDWNDTDDSQ